MVYPTIDYTTTNLTHVPITGAQVILVCSKDPILYEKKKVHDYNSMEWGPSEFELNFPEDGEEGPILYCTFVYVVFMCV